MQTSGFGIYSLNFFIYEGKKYQIDTINYGSEIQKTSFFKDLNEDFINKLNKNNKFYDRNLLTNYLEEINQSLLLNNIYSYYVDFDAEKNGDFLNLNFYEK